MNRQQVTRNHQQSKNETPLASGILQRSAVSSEMDDVQLKDDHEAQALINSAFSQDFSKVPISGNKPQQFAGTNQQGHLMSPIQAKLTIGQPGDQYEQAAQLQIAANHPAQQQQPSRQKKASSEPSRRENNTGLPDNLKSGIENLSGYSMDDVKVHYNSDQPTKLQAHAYAQGTDIHVAPRQEKHLPHEAWHVVQQKQGRVKPTMQIKGEEKVNDDAGLEKEADVMGTKAHEKGVSQLRRINSRFTPLSEVKQRHKNSSFQTSGVIQRVDPWDANANLAETNEENAQNARLGLPAPPNPIAIGPVQIPGPPPTTTGNQKHFDPDMLAEIASILNYLPAEHIIGNPALTQVVMEHDDGSGVSSFGGGQLHVVVPQDVSSWIYLSVNKWPLGDLATTLLTNINYGQDTENPHLGMKIHETLGRDVVGTGTVFNKLSMMTEGFVNWMLKHETGHSVDAAIGWEANHHYRLPALGGWLIHDGTDNTLANMSDGMLNAMGLGANQAALNTAYNNHTPHGNYVNAILTPALRSFNPQEFDVAGRNAAMNAYEAAVPGGRDEIIHLEKVLKSGMDSPWQKGGKGGIPFGNRTYQVEYQHSRWVSYESAKYQDRNSNYQYSGPEEWFAETYAHYFKHSSWELWRTASSQWGEKLNDAAARQWFRNNLDPVNAPIPPGPLLYAGNALQNIAGLAPAMPAQNAVAAPTMNQRVGEKLKNFFITVKNVGVHGMLDILTTAFSIPIGLLKYLVYVPLKLLWRWILSLF
ncbi:DUF4157 domain-containing protein [Nodularia spumigena CS-591/12]|uniref:eCIS core domain-containing protein n=1 Tax=Nodularia spumigena TaxID=70799 RepID=UPI00232CBE62|nr:DUF4157 domain-containing protein [Nodularia spumigena]MDB9305186.1 DUF4157 domain-containing protein [Nodularia spumigena CS-591/12]